MMPRDLSGNYSRVIPPGASGYQANTDILSAQVNGEINDIGNELTKSLAKDGTTAPTNNLPMANFVHSGMGQADAAGESLRYEALGKGSDIAVTANGAVTLPFEGSLFNLTAAAAFNVTGFTGRHDGRPFCVRFNPDKLLTLVNSATFKLLGGSNRIAKAGEIVHFVQESAGTIAEVGQQPIIDLTGYAGADVALGVGQSAIYDVSAVTSLLLRLVAGDNQEFEVKFNPTVPAGVGAGGVATLSVNNTALGATVFTAIQGFNSAAGVGVTAQGGSMTQTGTISLGVGVTELGFLARVCTRTIGKTSFSTWIGRSNTNNFAGYTNVFCSDITTVITSLGTLTFGNAVTGRIMVRRLM